MSDHNIDIDESEGYILAAGVLVKSLKRFGWPAKEVEQVHREIHLTILAALDKAREPLLRELAAYTAEFGFDERALLGLARTEYAMKGIEIASDLHRKRLAACN